MKWDDEHSSFEVGSDVWEKPDQREIPEIKIKREISGLDRPFALRDNQKPDSNKIADLKVQCCSFPEYEVVTEPWLEEEKQFFKFPEMVSMFLQKMRKMPILNASKQVTLHFLKG